MTMGQRPMRSEMHAVRQHDEARGGHDEGDDEIADRRQMQRPGCRQVVV